MRNATILLLVDADDQPSELAPLLDSVRDLGIHLSVVVMGAMPRMPVYAYGAGEYGVIAFPDGWTDSIEETRARLEANATVLRDDLGRQGYSAEVEAVMAEPVALDAEVARRALTCDLVVISDGLRDESDAPSQTAQAALFQIPVGLLINGARRPRALQPERVLLAWNSGLPAARAAHAALPLLREAEEVTVAVFDPVATPSRDGENPGSGMAQWLSHHGCKVDVQQYPSGGIEIGQAILDRAREMQADLVVMGAYEHSRMRELILGGTTRTMMAQRELPVLLAH
ncbi:universal stress protein [uncultured Jannaschia sp.]|uniref:universal stress protein n=1 Tax=uncultured Jannaschia sp. TaxID=293347 RepID=UPI00262C0B7D|nr:universal stress protein [uncultured Jannaschia sp.]